MPRQLDANLTFEIADNDEGIEDWKVNQDILEHLVEYARTIDNRFIVGEPQVRRVVPKTKTKE